MLVGRPRRIIHVERFSTMPRLRKENVGEHSFLTVFYSMLIGMELVDQGVSVDLAKLLMSATVHDIDEGTTGDVVRLIKRHNDDIYRSWKRLESEAVLEISRNIGVDIYSYWSTAKDDTVEGLVLSLADLISVSAYAIEEVQLGSSYMKRALVTNKYWLEKFVKEKLDKDSSDSDNMVRCKNVLLVITNDIFSMIDKVMSGESIYPIDNND